MSRILYSTRFRLKDPEHTGKTTRTRWSLAGGPRPREPSRGHRDKTSLTVSRKGEACVEIIASQVGEIRKDLRFWHARREIIKHVIDGDSKTSNAGFATHLIGLDGDDLAIVHSGFNYTGRDCNTRRFDG